jgi:hypothetical protein
MYKRDKTAIICEVIVPVFLVLIGCILNTINYTQKSYTIPVTPDLYPSPQRIQLNLDNVVSTTDQYTPEQLYMNMPGTKGINGNWNANFTANGVGPFASLKYYEQTYDLSLEGNPEPVRYGSYQIYMADSTKQQY